MDEHRKIWNIDMVDTHNFFLVAGPLRSGSPPPIQGLSGS